MPLTQTELTAKFEGFQSTPYQCTAGKLTIGYGWNMQDNPMSACEKTMFQFAVNRDWNDNPMTRQEATEILEYQIGKTASALADRVKDWEHIPPAIRMVLVDMGYNMGVPGLLRFRNTLKAVAAGDWFEMAVEMENSAWYKQVGRRSKYLQHMVLEFAHSNAAKDILG